jgi:proline iminopeptidase
VVVLYPSIKPYAVHQLAVDELHTLYVEESGNPKGVPVLFIHGGPGAGCDPDHRRFFDPTLYRIVLFDQRGAGHSIPHAELENNTTPHLVADMEAIRNQLGIDRWVLFGGSWGSTLALVYAETYPGRVLSMILRGIFLGRNEDFDWFMKVGGASRIFPDAWQEFINHLPGHEQADVLNNYYRRLTGEDELVRMSAAKAWAQWEAVCSTLQPSSNTVARLTNSHTAMSLARVEAHYFVNKLFLDNNYILNNAYKIADIPGVIVHGRYDMVCPLDNAYALNQAWPKSELDIIRDGGHSASEGGISNALLSATNRFAKYFSV